MTDYQHQIAVKRAQLAEHVEALEEKLDVPLQTRLAMDRVRESIRLQPMPWIVGAGTVALTTGLLAWRLLRR